MTSKTPFFVKRSRSPSRKSPEAGSKCPEEEKFRASIDNSPKVANSKTKVDLSAFQQYEKIMTDLMVSPAKTERLYPSEKIEAIESSDLSDGSEDYNPKSPSTLSPVIEPGILEEDEEPETVITTDDIDFRVCDDLCSHSNVIKEKGFTICSDCGTELYEDISHEQDWRYFGDADTRNATDPSRCQYRKTPEKGIKKDLERLIFPPEICELADKLYMEVTKGEVKRSELRKGIMFAVVFEAYKMKGKARTPDDLQKKFGLSRQAMSQGLTYYCLKCPREHFKYEDISAKHFIPQIMKKLNVNQEHIDKVILLFEKIKDVCPVINRSNPQSTSKALVYYYLRRRGCYIFPVRYSRIVGLSEVIILRIAGEISRVLGTQASVNLV